MIVEEYGLGLVGMAFHYISSSAPTDKPRNMMEY